ncbi:uncharacterized protein IWZ02DRAFT_485731 [Phyllosticta citriasiana]|uniref:uncharacterized protein n=1 Tax=Phyllosticta citriasiana TaxID=595635 RepID=UPI0030FD927E
MEQPQANDPPEPPSYAQQPLKDLPALLTTQTTHATAMDKILLSFIRARGIRCCPKTSSSTTTTTTTTTTTAAAAATGSAAAAAAENDIAIADALLLSDILTTSIWHTHLASIAARIRQTLTARSQPCATTATMHQQHPNHPAANQHKQRRRRRLEHRRAARRTRSRNGAILVRRGVARGAGGAARGRESVSGGALFASAGRGGGGGGGCGRGGVGM